jgi:hypothetical protein
VKLIRRLCKHWEDSLTAPCVYVTAELSITNCDVFAAADLFRRVTPDLVASPSMERSPRGDRYKWPHGAPRFHLSTCTNHPWDRSGKKQFCNGSQPRLGFLSHSKLLLEVYYLTALNSPRNKSCICLFMVRFESLWIVSFTSHRIVRWRNDSELKWTWNEVVVA